MKKWMSFLVFFIILSGCKDEIVKKPQRLIEKGVMVNIMYDLSLLEAIKYQNPTSLEAYKINPADYVYKKYKIDSTQFAQNNIYYASNYIEYKDMFDQITKRIDGEKAIADSLAKLEKKKKEKKEKAVLLLHKDTLMVKKAMLEHQRNFMKVKSAKEHMEKKELLH